MERIPSASSSDNFLLAAESVLLGDRTCSWMTANSSPRPLPGYPFGWGWSGAESATERPRMDLTRDDRTSRIVSVYPTSWRYLSINLKINLLTIIWNQRSNLNRKFWAWPLTAQLSINLSKVHNSDTCQSGKQHWHWCVIWESLA